MTDNDKDVEIAVFRFGIISDFVTGTHFQPGEKIALMRAKTARAYKIPHSKSGRVSLSTIKKWISDYRKAGCRLEGLMPSKRKDKGEFKSLTETLQTAIKEIKGEKPELPAVALVKILRERSYLGAGDKINMGTLYRFLKKHDLERPREKKDRRAFEAEFPNQLWQSDVLHGPMVKTDKGKRKSYLIAILDDRSRLVPHAGFYFSETLRDFKKCLMQALEKRGLPQKLYIDNGACYKAVNLEQVTARLSVGITHTPPYTPEGRGKMERWFGYVKTNFLPVCPEDLTLDELNERFADWVEEYHNRVHSMTKEKPLERFQKNMKCVRPTPANVKDYFRLAAFRRVKKDRTCQLNGVCFEVPVGLIDYRVELRYHQESPEDVEVFHDGRSFGKAVLLDRNVNFKTGRNRKPTAASKREEIKPGELF